MILYYSFFTRPANTVVPIPIRATMANDQRRFNASAIKPIKGGPIKNPRKPIVETAASAAAGAI